MPDYYKSKVWLTRKVRVDGLSREQIAQICGVDKQTIWRWMKKFGLI